MSVGRRGVVLICAVLALVACRGVTVAPVQQLATAARTGEALAPVQVDRIVFNFQPGQQIGAYRSGGVYTGCGRTISPEPIHWQGGSITARDAELREVLGSELARAGYNVVGASGQLFEEVATGAAEPEYLIGGRIDQVLMDVCDEVSMMNGRLLGTQSGEISMQVTWQVYSTLDRAIVLETKSSGGAELDEGMRDGEVQLMLLGLASATRNLAADANFHAVLRQAGRVQPAAAGSTPAGFEPLPPIVLRPVARPESSVTENMKRAQASVVTIRSGIGQGSGFFIAPDLVLTNEHVVGGSTRVKVVLLDGTALEARVLRRTPGRDVALVQVLAGNHAPLPLRLDRPGLAEEVYAVGSPLDESLAGTITRGIVSQFQTDSGGFDLIQADVTIQQGSSGGPLLDTSGRVIGLSQSALAGADDLSMGINFFIPIADALKHLSVKFAHQ